MTCESKRHMTWANRRKLLITWWCFPQSINPFLLPSITYFSNLNIYCCICYIVEQKQAPDDLSQKAPAPRNVVALPPIIMLRETSVGAETCSRAHVLSTLQSDILGADVKQDLVSKSKMRRKRGAWNVKIATNNNWWAFFELKIIWTIPEFEVA